LKERNKQGTERRHLEHMGRTKTPDPRGDKDANPKTGEKKGEMQTKEGTYRDPKIEQPPRKKNDIWEKGRGILKKK